MKIDWKLLTTFAFSIGIVYIFGFLLSPNCADCFRPHGWPFPYYREGGYAGGARYIWGGMLGDFAFAVTASMLLWMAWNAALPRSVRIAERDLRRRSWGWICMSYSLILLLDVINAVIRQRSGQIDPTLAPSGTTELFGVILVYTVALGLAAWLAVKGIRKIFSPQVTAMSNNARSEANVESANDHL